MLKIFQLQNKKRERGEKNNNKQNKTRTTVIKNELKYFPMSEGKTCIAEQNREVP